jgi:hypothetical protein
MKILSLALLALILTSPAHALTDKEKRQMKAWNDYLESDSQSSAKRATEKCGFVVPTKLDDAFATSFIKATAHAGDYCDSVRSAVADYCGDEIGKSSVKEKIKKISCKLGKDSEVSFKLVSGDLQATLGLNAGNIKDKTKEFLENQ